MSWLLHHHDGILTRANGRYLWRVLDGAVPADGGEGAADGGVFVPAEVDAGRVGGVICGGGGFFEWWTREAGGTWGVRVGNLDGGRIKDGHLWAFY